MTNMIMKLLTVFILLLPEMKEPFNAYNKDSDSIFPYKYNPLHLIASSSVQTYD